MRVRRVLLTLLALFLAVVGGALWYASNKGFTSKWRGYVSEEFRKRGVEVTLRKLTLDIRRGLVAKEVRVFDAFDRRRTLAVIDEMALQVNYANLARGQTFIDALDLRDANLSLPLDPEKPRGPKLEIVRLNARLFLPPRQIYLASAEAEIFGLRVSAAGRLIHPEALPRRAPNSDGWSPELIARIFEEISAVKIEGEAPVMNITFSGDLAAPDQLFVEAALWGEGLRRKSYLLKSLYVAASYRGGILDLKQLVAADAAGELHVAGLWDFAAKQGRMQLRSSLDAPALARASGDFPWLNDLVLYAPPELDLRLEMAAAGAFTARVLGRVDLRKFAYRSVVFEGASADFSWDGARWSVRDVQVVRNGPETLTGDVMRVPDDFRAQVRSTINPKSLRTLASGQLAEALAQLEFSKPPEVSITARGKEPTIEALTLEGDLKLGPGSFRAVAAESLTANFRYENRVLSLAPFRVQRLEGEGGGALHFDFRRDEVRLEKIRARVNPPEVAMWIDQRLVKDILPYRFPKQPPNLLIDGLVHTKKGKTTRLSIEVDAPAGMDYTFLRKNLSASAVSGKLLFTSDRLKITDLSATIFGGSLKGQVDVSLVPEKPGHMASLAVQNVDFASVTKLYFDYENSQGRLNGRYEFSGRGNDARTMEGRGEIRIDNGNVFAIPFLGPLSGILDTIVPGMGHDVARQGSATFTISQGVIATDDLVVQGNGFSMIGGGKLFFVDDRMDFDMRINAQGLSGVLLFPVSKLFEYTSDQTLSKPVWRLKIVPRL